MMVVRGPRLQRNDFIALRSLAQRPWYQGDTISWKFNRAWRSVSYAEVPALETADRLAAAGLAEFSVCCSGCERAMIRLTERGEAFVHRMSTPLQAIEVKKSAPRSWARRALRTFSERLQRCLRRGYTPL